MLGRETIHLIDGASVIRVGGRESSNSAGGVQMVHIALVVSVVSDTLDVSEEEPAGVTVSAYRVVPQIHVTISAQPISPVVIKTGDNLAGSHVVE